MTIVSKNSIRNANAKLMRGGSSRSVIKDSSNATLSYRISSGPRTISVSKKTVLKAASDALSRR